MTKTVNKVRAGVALAALLVLGACGGGDDEPPVTSQVPASASASIAGFIGYLQALVVVMTEELDPVDVSGVTPPVDEISDPTVLN